MASKGPIPRPIQPKPRSNRGPTPRNRGPVVAIDRTAGPPPPPKDLEAAGREAWQQFWTASWLAPADEIGVRILCQIVDSIEAMEAQIRAEGRTSKGSKGQPVAHPLLAPVHALRMAFLSWVGDYGFSPMSRARLRIELVPKTAPSILDRFIAKGRGDDDLSAYAHLRERDE